MPVLYANPTAMNVLQMPFYPSPRGSPSSRRASFSATQTPRLSHINVDVYAPPVHRIDSSSPYTTKSSTGRPSTGHLSGHISGHTSGRTSNRRPTPIHIPAEPRPYYHPADADSRAEPHCRSPYYQSNCQSNSGRRSAVDQYDQSHNYRTVVAPLPTPTYKRRREDSPEMTHARTTPRPDRQRRRLSMPRVDAVPVEKLRYRDYEYADALDPPVRMPMTPVSRPSLSRPQTPRVVESVERCDNEKGPRPSWERCGYTYGSGPVATRTFGNHARADKDHLGAATAPARPYSRSRTPSPSTTTTVESDVRERGAPGELKRFKPETRYESARRASDRDDRASRTSRASAQTKSLSRSQPSTRSVSRSSGRRSSLSEYGYEADCDSEESYYTARTYVSPAKVHAARARRGSDAVQTGRPYVFSDAVAYVPRSAARPRTPLDREDERGQGRGRDMSVKYPPLSGLKSCLKTPRSSRSSSVGARGQR